MEERDLRANGADRAKAREVDLFSHLAHDPPAPTPAASRADELLEGLNPAQREAVLHDRGPLLILAGPGSGKTRVITRRIAYLVNERKVEPWRILAITFTNKAAREMVERVERLLPLRGAWIGTFHALCARILRREIAILGGYTSDFTIYDTGDRNQLLKSLIREAGYDTTRFKPSAVGAWISTRKNTGFERVEPAVEGEGQSIEAEMLAKLSRMYADALRKANALDFDDLLLKVLELFDAHPGVRDTYARRFLHVMVDEYQDTNRVQYSLTRHFGSAHHNVAVCGDPDQSIYRWRGADVRNILEFENDHPDCKVVMLEQNYRSTNTILKVAQAVIGHNRGRKPKDLWSELGDGAPLTMVRCADEEDEAREIAAQVRAHLQSGGKARDVAVFYRVNFMQRALETGLRLARIPYQIVGGTEFYERREIRDLVAWAKLAVNPADDVAFRRVVNVPQRGVGDKSLEVLVSFAADRRIPLATAVRSTELLARIRGRARAGLEEFGAFLGRLSTLRDQPAGFALERILEDVDRDKWLAEMADEQNLDRDANVDELLAHAEHYDQLVEAKRAAGEGDELVGHLRGFLQDIALVSDVDDLEDASDKVTLMTLHSAKGLEYPIVFIAGLEEELLPHARALQEGDPLEGIEEERRLFYVGITRAQRRLFLMHAQQRLFFGQTSFRGPSRFLEEIPGRLVEGFEPDRDEAEMLGAFEPTAKTPTFDVGDRVEHDHFGRGTVERLQGTGVNARATVHFPAHGTKHLLLQYAKLTRLASGAKNGRGPS